MKNIFIITHSLKKFLNIFITHNSNNSNQLPVIKTCRDVCLGFFLTFFFFVLVINFDI